MELMTFSCFDNFVPSVKYGVPAHCPNHNGLEHLEKLFDNLLKAIKLANSGKDSSIDQPQVGT